MHADKRSGKVFAIVRYVAIIAAGITIGAPICLSQAIRTPSNVPSPTASFEVAVIQPTPPDNVRGTQWSRPGGTTFTAANVTLELLTTMAWNIDASQIQNAPASFTSKHFDLTARAEAGIDLTRDALRPRLQTLLQQRFHLAIHHATVSKKGFALVVARRGSKLAGRSNDQPMNFRQGVGPGKLQGRNWSMEFCALMLVSKVSAPVIDRTGLTGRYDVDVQYAPDGSEDTTFPSLTTALQDRLGLRLQPEMVPVDIIVIDHADQSPTDN